MSNAGRGRWTFIGNLDDISYDAGYSRFISPICFCRSSFFLAVVPAKGFIQLLFT